MTVIAYWCVFAAALLPYAFTGIAKFSGGKKLGSKANHAPREWLENLEGAKKRAHWAQLNSFETFPAFAAAVIVASLVGGNPAVVDILALGFLAFRMLYGWCYISDRAALRTLMFTGGSACVIGIFLSPLL